MSLKNLIRSLAILVTLGITSVPGFAQHEHHQQKLDTTMSKAESGNNPSAMDQDHDMDSGMLASHAYSLNLPMRRNGSGTAWAPDASPMYMYMSGTERKNWMFHGSLVLRYNNQDLFDKGSRGDTKFDAPNWFMVMHNRRVGEKGLFNATAMLSFDAFTVGENGYPLLYQSGETYNGSRMVDRQHPHDLFSALSVAYTHSFDKDIDVTAYLGYPGEPALGPVAFMHRVSAMNNPDAPLSHHWQDATHITFGVSTLGFRWKRFKVEGSIFTGREPDENRYDFDQIKFDSYSYRVSYNPDDSWAIQFSQGFLKEPEVVEPGVDQVRTTASISRTRNMRTLSLSQSLIWGMNKKSGHSGGGEHAILFENNLQLRRQAIYGRYEFVNKSSEELNLDAHFGHRRFNVNALTIGYNRNIAPAAPVEVLLGTQATFNFSAKDLTSIYGKVPLGFEVYLQFRPHKH